MWTHAGETCVYETIRTAKWSKQKTHRGDKPYICQLCQKYFSLLSNMKRNERIHMGEDRFFAIYVIDQLVIYCSRNSYVLIHSRDKSYICHLGSRPFISRGTLTLHIRCHDGVTLSDTQRNAMDRSAWWVAQGLLVADIRSLLGMRLHKVRVRERLWRRTLCQNFTDVDYAMKCLKWSRNF